MSVAAFILNAIFRPRLQKASVLAVYDPDRRYQDLCQSLADSDTTLVDASESSILAREGAMLALAGLGKLGSVEIHREFITAAARRILAAKL